MKKDKDIQEELESLSPFLSELKKQKKGDGFQVPSNFFEQLPDLVLKQVETEKEVRVVPAQRISWWDNLQNSLSILFQPRYAVGFATIALLVVAMFYITPSPVSIGHEIALQDISSAEIDAYINQHLDDFQEEILADKAMIEILEEGSELNVKDEELEEYIDEMLEDVDVSTLENFL